MSNFYTRYNLVAVLCYEDYSTTKYIFILVKQVIVLYFNDLKFDADKSQWTHRSHTGEQKKIRSGHLFLNVVL